MMATNPKKHFRGHTCKHTFISRL